jgi:hypothetical protein
MSHIEQQAFVSLVKSIYPFFFTNVKVLEIGSLDINGSVRTHFDQCDFLGVDLGSGPGVDLVSAGEDLLFPDRSFEVCISTECFEHAQGWHKIFTNMVRMSNGLVIFSAGSKGRKEHGTPRTSPADSPFTSALGDYYHNIEEADFSQKFLSEHFQIYSFSENTSHHDLYFWGVKKEFPLNFQIQENAYQSDPLKVFEIMRLARELNEIKESKSWKITKPYRYLRNIRW